jgi:small nuclear ribonucleoprotein (snRNP)-like protein
MKTIDLMKTADPLLSQILAQAEDENVIVRTPEGREFVVAELDDFDRELELTRNNAEFMRLLDERSKEKAVYSADDIRREFGIE